MDEEVLKSREAFVSWYGLRVKEDGINIDYSGLRCNLLKINSTSGKLMKRRHLINLIGCRLQVNNQHLKVETNGIIIKEIPKNNLVKLKAQLKTARKMTTQTGNQLMKFESSVILRFKNDLFGKEQVKYHLTHPKYIKLQQKHIRYLTEVLLLEKEESALLLE